MLRAICAFNAGSHRGNIAILVADAEMRRRQAFFSFWARTPVPCTASWAPGADILHRFVWVNVACALSQVIGVDQRGDRYWNEITICDIKITIRKGELACTYNQMHRLNGKRLILAEIKMIQNT